MREGETLKSYSDRYWEMFNEIEGKNDPMAITTFKAGLPADHDLRKSLTGKPVSSVRQLMDRIEKYKRIEEDQLQGKGKAKVIPQERRDFRSVVDQGGILLGSRARQMPRLSMQYFGSLFSRFWRR